MHSCAIPNCNIKPSSKSKTTINKFTINFWKKILKIKNTKLCDHHLTVVCQSCMRSFDHSELNGSSGIVGTTETFQKMFRDIIGYEIPVGAICSKCCTTINDFAKFRHYVRLQQELRISATAEHPEDAEYEVVEYQDEDYFVKVLEPEVENITIKEEHVDYEDLKVDYNAEDTASTVDQEEIDETIIKVEPIEYDQEFQMITNDQKMPKIENPRTLPARQTIKRKIIEIESKPNPKSLKTALESSRRSSKCKKIPQGSLKCQYCTERFDNCDLILEHIDKKHKFQCKICHTSFPFKINLIHHQFLSHKESSMVKSQASRIMYPCGSCKMNFSNFKLLTFHINKEHNVNMKEFRLAADDEQQSSKLSSRILNSFKKSKPASTSTANIRKES